MSEQKPRKLQLQIALIGGGVAVAVALVGIIPECSKSSDQGRKSSGTVISNNTNSVITQGDGNVVNAAK